VRVIVCYDFCKTVNTEGVILVEYEVKISNSIMLQSSCLRCIISLSLFFSPFYLISVLVELLTFFSAIIIAKLG